MSRISVPAAAVVAAVAGTVVLATAGSARTPGGRTITFLDDTSHAAQTLIDSPPKSPARNPRSARFRLSTGDTLYIRSALLDHAGDKRIGTAYSQFIVVKGDRFANAVFRGHGTFRLHGGQITADGVLRPAKPTNTVAVLGGTGAYEGARGSLTFTEAGQGSRDTVHVSP